MADNTNNEGTPASIWLVALGILIAAVGWMVAQRSADPGYVGLGAGLESVGGLLFFLGILIEFFSIGASLRRITRLLQLHQPGSSSEVATKDEGQRLPVGTD